jgi:hypothetical protein
MQKCEDEPWKESKEPVKYIPLQAKEGDLAIFLRKEAYEIEFEKEKLLIVPQSAILLLIEMRISDFLREVCRINPCLILIGKIKLFPKQLLL